MTTPQDILTYVEGVIAGTPLSEIQALVGVGVAIEKLIADAIAGNSPAPDGIEVAEKTADAAENEKFK